MGHAKSSHQIHVSQRWSNSFCLNLRCVCLSTPLTTSSIHFDTRLWCQMMSQAQDGSTHIWNIVTSYLWESGDYIMSTVQDSVCVWGIIVCWIHHQSFLFHSEPPTYGEWKSQRLLPQQMIRAVLITLNYNTGRLQHILLHLNNKRVFTAKSKQHILPLALKAQNWWVSKSASYYDFCSLKYTN